MLRAGGRLAGAALAGGSGAAAAGAGQACGLLALLRAAPGAWPAGALCLGGGGGGGSGPHAAAAAAAAPGSPANAVPAWPQQAATPRAFGTAEQAAACQQPAAAAVDPGGGEAGEAAARQQLLARLQGLGLQRDAALAVQKAVAGGFAAAALRFWTRPGCPRRELQPSAARVAACARRLLRAHARAAAAPAAARAGTWGALDVQALLARDPGVVLVPPGALGASLDRLLSELAAVLGPASAAAFVQGCPELTTQLRRQRAPERLAGIAAAYEDVLGRPPRPTTLAAASSSFTRNSVATVRAKLTRLADRFGADVVHGAVSAQPHLLSSSATTMLSNAALLQQLLGLSDADMQRIVRRSPRVLTSNPRTLAAQLAANRGALQCVGLSAGQVSALAVKYPLIITANPVSLQAKLAALQGVLGPYSHRLPYLLRAQPSLLNYSPDSLDAKVDALGDLLALRRRDVLALTVRAASLLSVSSDYVAAQVDAHSAALGVARETLLAMARTDPQLLTLSPASVSRKLGAICAGMGWTRDDALHAVASYPRLLVSDAAAVVAHMRLLNRLVAASSRWADGAARHCSRRAALLGAGGGGDSSGGGGGAGGEGGSGGGSVGGGRAPAWQAAYSCNSSGRLPLRLEYLLATGRQEEVALAAPHKQAAGEWAARFPDYASWAALRLEHLARDPEGSGWTPALVAKAAAAAAKEAERARAQAPQPAARAAAATAAEPAETGGGGGEAAGQRRRRRTPPPPPPRTQQAGGRAVREQGAALGAPRRRFSAAAAAPQQHLADQAHAAAQELAAAAAAAAAAATEAGGGAALRAWWDHRAERASSGGSSGLAPPHPLWGGGVAAGLSGLGDVGRWLASRAGRGVEHAPALSDVLRRRSQAISAQLADGAAAAAAAAALATGGAAVMVA
ncbi:hypothetical protein HT031_003251 [Scenedesmus sp. PABB004]|nr:hypothetical protein HT031_003251 [Scenedesmus sp. PABB004]